MISSNSSRKRPVQSQPSSSSNSTFNTYQTRQRTAQQRRKLSELYSSSSSLPSSSNNPTAALPASIPSNASYSSSSSSVALASAEDIPSDQPTKKQMLVASHAFSPIERWIQHDSDSPSIVLQMLEWKEIAKLHRVCQAARQYISTTGQAHINSNKTLITSDLSRYPPSCWLHHHVRAVIYSHFGNVHFILESLPKPAFYCLRNFRATLPTFLHFDSILKLTSCFPLLEELSLQFSKDPLGNIEGKSIAKYFTETASLSRLSLLPNLTAFSVTTDFCFWASELQVAELLLCNSLKRLHWGHWVAGACSSPEMGSPEREEWLEDRVARLQDLSNLEELDVSRDRMQMDAFKQLVKCQSLTSLSPFSWTRDVITSKDLHLIATLPNLTQIHFHIESPHAEVNVMSDSFASAVSKCPVLSQLSLSNMRVNRQQLQLLCTSLTHLKELKLTHVRLESVEPLSCAKSLEGLTIVSCTDVEKQDIHWPLKLPRLPQLKRCCIQDNLWNSVRAAGITSKLVYNIMDVYMLALRVQLPCAKPEDIQVSMQFTEYNQHEHHAYDDEDSDEDEEDDFDEDFEDFEDDDSEDEYINIDGGNPRFYHFF